MSAAPIVEVKPVAWIVGNKTLVYTDENPNTPYGDNPIPLYSADQLREAQVKVLREAAHRQAEFGRGGDLLRMADELENGK